ASAGMMALENIPDLENVMHPPVISRWPRLPEDDGGDRIVPGAEPESQSAATPGRMSRGRRRGDGSGRLAACHHQAKPGEDGRNGRRRRNPDILFLIRVDLHR